MGGEAVGANTIDVYPYDITDLLASRGNVNRLQIGRTAHDLPRMTAGALEQKRQFAADAGGIEAPLLRLEQSLKGRQALGLDGLRNLVLALRRGRAGPGGIFE